MADIHIPTRSGVGDQILESVTNTGGNEEQVVRVGGTFPIAAVTDTLTGAAGDTVVHSSIQHAGTALIMVYGPSYSGASLIFEILNSGGGNTTWVPIPASRVDTGALQSSTGVLPANTTAAWRVPIARVDQLRVRSLATITGTCNVIIDPAVPFGEPIVNAIINNPPGSVETRFVYAGAGSATEAIASVQAYRAGVASGAAATTQAITAGKTFRLMFLSAMVRATVATAGGGGATLRYNPSGAAVVGSPQVASAGGTIAAAVGSSDTGLVSFPAPGPEFTGGQFAITHIAAPATVQWVVVAGGIEY